MLDARGPLQAAETRNEDGIGLADAAEIVAQDVDDHRVLRSVLGAAEQLAGQPAVLFRGAATRPRALDRIRLDHTHLID